MTPKPNLIDRVVGWFSPRAAVERQAWRQMTNSVRDGIRTRDTESYSMQRGERFGSQSDRTLLLNVRDRAYAAYEKNLVARTLVNTETDNVIGDGLNYQPTSDSEAWNAEAKDRYYRWLETASIRGADIMSGCELQRQLWSQSRIAGDVGWLLVSQGAESVIQIVPAENIVTPDDARADRSIYEGIKYDATGAPVTFYVLTNDDRTGERKFAPVSYRDFVYLPHFTRTNQARGESCFVTVFDLLAHLDRYVDGVSLAAWMATVFGIVFKEPTAAKQFSALPSLTNSQGNAQRALTLENGQVKYLAPEGEVVQVDAKQPMNQTPDFIRAMYRMLGQPFDMPLEVFAKDMSSCNFASARIGLLPFYRSCRIKAARFGTRWSRTIRWWLSREKNRAPGDPKRWKTAFPENYFDHELIPNAWSYTDPVREVQGDHLQLDMKTKSPQQVIAERGGDPKQIIKEWTEWAEMTKDLPSLLSTLSRDPSSPAAEMPVDPATDPNAPESDDTQGADTGDNAQ